jgi:hypothetical protein
MPSGQRSTTHNIIKRATKQIAAYLRNALSCLAVDSQAAKVWYVSTKQDALGDYNLITKKFDKEIRIPIWNVRKNPIWFMDKKQNTIWR